MIHFHQVDPTRIEGAYQWHRGYASGDGHVFPRGKTEYGEAVVEGAVWCATKDNEYCAMACHLEKPGAWEIGGLMVEHTQRGSGIGSALARILLCNLLTELDPLHSNERVYAYVLAQNDKPRKLIEATLKFRHIGSIALPGDQLPGLAVDDDGLVHGDEFELVVPDSVAALIDWLETWSQELADGTPVQITLQNDRTLSGWVDDLREMIAENT